MLLNVLLEINYSSKKPTYSNIHVCLLHYQNHAYYAIFLFSKISLSGKDPHNLNVDVLALFLNSKCFHVLVMVNPFYSTENTSQQDVFTLHICPTCFNITHNSVPWYTQHKKARTPSTLTWR